MRDDGPLAPAEEAQPGNGLVVTSTCQNDDMLVTVTLQHPAAVPFQMPQSLILQVRGALEADEFGTERGLRQERDSVQARTTHWVSVTMLAEGLAKIRPSNGLGGVAAPESWCHQALLGALG